MRGGLMMQSIKLFMRLAPYVNIRWKMTLLAYFLTFLGLTLNLLQPFLFLYLIDDVLIGKQVEYLMPIIILMGSFAVASSVLTTVRAAMFRNLGIRHTLDIRNV